MIGTLSGRNLITSGTNSAKTVCIRQDLDIIGTQSARNAIVLFFSKSCPFITTASRHRPDYTGQILIRHSRICYDNVTIVIRLEKSAESLECYGTNVTVRSVWLTFQTRRTLLRLYVQTMIRHSRSFRIVNRLFQFFLCRSAIGTQMGAIIGSV